tara:strand:+ start:276 stop:896 length:621 start_codon:yes stop_codon:yes gene_type:complete
MVMMGWFTNKKRIRELEEKAESGFSAVKKDMDGVGKWVKHLHGRDKELFEVIGGLKKDLSTVVSDLEMLKDAIEIGASGQKNKQVFKKLPVLDKQTGVEGVQEAVQTAVQTGNFYDILKGLSSNERLLVFTLMNSDMKLSYEDLAMLLGKERSTVRGQVNSVKQKTEGLIGEFVEKNGKKRVFVPDEIKAKLAKYAKVRDGKNKKE